MADDVRLNINITGGDGGSGGPPNPLSDVNPLSKDDLVDGIAGLFDEAGINDLVNSLKKFVSDPVPTLNSGKTENDKLLEEIDDLAKLIQIPEDIFEEGLKAFSDAGKEFDAAFREANTRIEDVFKKLAEISSLDTSVIGFLPEDFEEKLDAFFAAIQEDTDAINKWNSDFDELLENQNEVFASLFGEIGSFIGTIGAWATSIGRAIALFSAFVVGASFYNQVIKNFFESLGEFAGQFRREQAEVSRDLMLRSLINTRRIDEQLAANEEARGDLAIELEQFKVEMFDLFSPAIWFVTETLAAIMNAINTVIAVLNLIKDALAWPFQMIASIANMLNPVSAAARKSLREEFKDNLDKMAPGLGSAADLFNMSNVGLGTNDLPEGLREDVVEHPFGDEIEGFGGGISDQRPWGGGGASRGW